jgi:hypothetical protein
MEDDQASLGEIKVGAQRGPKRAPNRAINEALRTTHNYEDNIPGGRAPMDPALCESGEGQIQRKVTGQGRGGR